MTDPKTKFRTIEIGELPCPRGTLKEITVKSAHLKGRADCSVYIPKQVEADQSVPVIILLHGVYGSHWAWNLKGKAYETLQSLIDSEEVCPAILATPSDGLWGDGSGYLPHDGQNFERWIVEDVPQLVAEATGNAPEAPHYIAGLSMGGFGALRLGALYPERFSAFYGHSSITRIAEMASFVQEPLSAYGEPAETRGVGDVFDIINEHRDQIGPFAFDCGTEDPLIDGNRNLHRRLIDAGLAHGYRECPGGHDWPYWTRRLPDCLRFFLNAHP